MGLAHCHYPPQVDHSGLKGVLLMISPVLLRRGA